MGQKVTIRLVDKGQQDAAKWALIILLDKLLNKELFPYGLSALLST